MRVGRFRLQCESSRRNSHNSKTSVDTGGYAPPRGLCKSRATAAGSVIVRDVRSAFSPRGLTLRPRDDSLGLPQTHPQDRQDQRSSEPKHQSGPVIPDQLNDGFERATKVRHWVFLPLPGENLAVRSQRARRQQIGDRQDGYGQRSGGCEQCRFRAAGRRPHDRDQHERRKHVDVLELAGGGHREGSGEKRPSAAENSIARTNPTSTNARPGSSDGKNISSDPVAGITTVALAKPRRRASRARASEGSATRRTKPARARRHRARRTHATSCRRALSREPSARATAAA